jgi:hypothetical protein
VALGGSPIGISESRRPLLGDRIGEGRVLRRVDDVDAARLHRDRAGGEARLVRGGVDAAGEARRRGVAGGAEVAGEPRRHAAAERRGVAGADERDRRAGRDAGRADRPEERRRVGEEREERRIVSARRGRAARAPAASAAAHSASAASSGQGRSLRARLGRDRRQRRERGRRRAEGAHQPHEGRRADPARAGEPQPGEPVRVVRGSAAAGIFAEWDGIGHPAGLGSGTFHQRRRCRLRHG